MTKRAQTGAFCRVQWSRGLEKAPAEAVVGALKGVGVIVWVHWWLGVSK